MFDVPMDALTMEETVQEIDRRMYRGQFTQHVVVNVAKLVQMQDDPVLAQAVITCDIISIDGAGIVIGGRLLGIRIPERVAGIDLFHRLLSYAEETSRSVFLLGATQPVLDAAISALKLAHPKLLVAGSHHGYFTDNEQEVVSKIRDSGADFLFVGISSPLKEQFIARWNRSLRVKFAMGVGGTFEVVAGKVRRAPSWMQDCGLEWFFRILQEPRRMWRRYLVTNSRYLAMLVAAKLRMWRS